MRLLLVINGLFETSAGVLMVMLPRVVVPGAVPETAIVIRILGFAGIAMAALSFSLAGVFTHTLGFESGLFALAVFHAGMTAGHYLGLTQQIVPVAAVVVHGVFASLFAVAFVFSGRHHT